MEPSAERLLRPVLAFLTLCLAAFLLAPTVASVHHKVEDLSFDRETPFHLWRWSPKPPPTMPFPNCGGAPRHLYSEITQWPTKIRKDEPFTLRGVTQSEEDGRLGVGTIKVDIFLNDTKSEPGVWLGEVESDAGGVFSLSTTVPFDLQAEHYHIVAHAKGKRISCTDYLEHWSDPEVDVLSKATLLFDEAQHPVVGRQVNLTGRLVDSVGGPIKNATLTMSIGGKRMNVSTDDEGAFVIPYVPEKAGELDWTGEYKGSDYYDPAKNATEILVQEEDLVLHGLPLVLLRSSESTISGNLYVADAARKSTLTIDFDGFSAATCAGCPANDTHVVPLNDDGSFAFTFIVPPTDAPGLYTVDVAGGGLKKTYTFNATLEAPSVLAIHANGTGLFTKGYEARAVLTDETGAPLVGHTVELILPAGTTTNTTDANGTIALSGTASCGASTAHANYAGADGIRAARAQDDLFVCGFLAFIPWWLLAIPWWVWPIALVAALVAWQLARGWRQKYAPIISGGPALTLAFTEPADEASGYATIGEAIVATAFLEEPLPDGHRLRIGTFRDIAEVPLDAELRAHWRVVPDKLGEIAVRAEVLDPRGRVVSRRTAHLHVVRYAEEIEHRYLALRKEHGHSEAVTPREFERWIHEQAPGLDPGVVRRLVHVFEEADYSPRVAGRAEFAAYLAAEGGVKEVAPDATLA